MTALWSSLSSDERAFAACGLTLLAGLLVACAIVMRINTRTVVVAPAVDPDRAADDLIFAWSAAAWAEFDLVERGTK